jgi:hypothetical protein
MATYSNSVVLSGRRVRAGATLAAERMPSMQAFDWIGFVSLFGIAVSINWWVVKSYSDRMEKRFDQQERRFDQQDKRFDQQERRFDGQDKRLDGHDQRFDRLEAMMLGLVSDVSLIKGAMGIYPTAKAKARSGE